MSQEKNEKLGFSKKSSGVVLKDVTKIFQQPDTGKDFVAVDHINLEIKDGEMVKREVGAKSKAEILEMLG